MVGVKAEQRRQREPVATVARAPSGASRVASERVAQRRRCQRRLGRRHRRRRRRRGGATLWAAGGWRAWVEHGAQIECEINGRRPSTRSLARSLARSTYASAGRRAAARRARAAPCRSPPRRRGRAAAGDWRRSTWLASPQTGGGSESLRLQQTNKHVDQSNPIRSKINRLMRKSHVCSKQTNRNENIKPQTNRTHRDESHWRRPPRDR